MNTSRDLSIEGDYRIAVITALHIELAAMELMLDGPPKDHTPHGDSLSYSLGTIGANKIVIVLLPKMGNNSAAAVTANLLNSFPNVDKVLMVGIAGGVPDPSHVDKHVRLGDLVISKDRGVIEFDYGKAESVTDDDRVFCQFTIRSFDPPPSAPLTQAAQKLASRGARGERPWEQYVVNAAPLENSSRPPAKTDVLHDSTDPSQIIAHPKDLSRRKGQPKLYYGTIGSSNAVIKNAKLRDQLRDTQGIQAIEMEGSGLATATWLHNRGGYLLIRGICDYCDGYKNDAWQPYAAAIAAAYAKALILTLAETTTNTSLSAPHHTHVDEYPPMDTALHSNLVQTLATAFPTRSKIDVLLGESLGMQLPPNIDEPLLALEYIVQYCILHRGETFGKLLNRAVETAPSVHQLRGLRALLVHHGYIPDHMRKLDEAIPGGFVISEGEYVNANGEPLPPPPRYPVLPILPTADGNDTNKDPVHRN